jgi:hypothetical protein
LFAAQNSEGNKKMAKFSCTKNHITPTEAEENGCAWVGPETFDEELGDWPSHDTKSRGPGICSQ